jgi:hypothetical protein
MIRVEHGDCRDVLAAIDADRRRDFWWTGGTVSACLTVNIGME